MASLFTAWPDKIPFMSDLALIINEFDSPDLEYNTPSLEWWQHQSYFDSQAQREVIITMGKASIFQLSALVGR